MHPIPDGPTCPVGPLRQPLAVFVQPLGEFICAFSG
jgi:hypothetical protein